MMLTRAPTIVFALSVSSMSAVHADEDRQIHTCPGPVAVLGEDAERAPLICDAVAHARTLLTPCGLVQTRPITVDIVSTMDERHAACVAYFNCDTDTLTLLPPSALARSKDVMSAFEGLSSEAYFRSVIVHEMTHALAHQSHGGSLTRVAHEYLAYAFQIASLSKKSRAKVLAAVPPEGAVGLDGIDEIALLFGPSQFALRAFQHFSQAGNGCAFVASIIDRDPALPEAFLLDTPEITP